MTTNCVNGKNLNNEEERDNITDYLNNHYNKLEPTSSKTPCSKKDDEEKKPKTSAGV